MAIRQRQAEQSARESEKRDIGWGSQIRSYVLDDTRVKDLRTDIEIYIGELAYVPSLPRLDRIKSDVVHKGFNPVPSIPGANLFTGS